jgi:adenine deaminase
LKFERLRHHDVCDAKIINKSVFSSNKIRRQSSNTDQKRSIQTPENILPLQALQPLQKKSIMSQASHSGYVVDLERKRIFKGTVITGNGIIQEIREEENESGNFIIPGFVDAHVHVESSMIIPSEFARLAVPHGTVATVSDPHEIGNVLGIEGVRYMLENGKKVPFKFYFGAPSCVPATTFETAGAVIDADDIEELLKMDDIVYLAEMMNFPGVLHQDETVMKKIRLTHQYGKVVDGHAPGLRGELAKQYIDAGISTDHECFTAEEALDKLKYGMKIIIREGSAAKNFNALIPLMHEHHDMMMFGSDDKHPNDLAAGHIDRLAARAVASGIDPMKVLRAASYNAVKHYGMKVGLLQKGDPADFIIVENLENFKVLQTYINGHLVAENGVTRIQSIPAAAINNFNCSPIEVKDIIVRSNSSAARVITVEDGQLITRESIEDVTITDGNAVSDTTTDILKMVVVNRYHQAPPAVCFVKNFGLKKGALASTVAHDSHNIIATGTNDHDIVNAINALVQTQGGVSAVCENDMHVLALPVAGLMSTDDGYKVATQYENLDRQVKEWGCTLQSPYMTLSFLALLVIPELKLSDKGLFDGNNFRFTSLFV